MVAANPRVAPVGCRPGQAIYEASRQPWFDFEYAPTRTRLTLCECQWFVRCLPPGIEPKRAGSIGRLTKMVVAPTGNGKQRDCCPHETFVAAF